VAVKSNKLTSFGLTCIICFFERTVWKASTYTTNQLWPTL